jgi:hypothetical protein
MAFLGEWVGLVFTRTFNVLAVGGKGEYASEPMAALGQDIRTVAWIVFFSLFLLGLLLMIIWNRCMHSLQSPKKEKQT